MIIEIIKFEKLLINLFMKQKMDTWVSNVKEKKSLFQLLKLHIFSLFLILISHWRNVDLKCHLNEIISKFKYSLNKY